MAEAEPVLDALMARYRRLWPNATERSIVLTRNDYSQMLQELVDVGAKVHMAEVACG